MIFPYIILSFLVIQHKLKPPLKLGNKKLTNNFEKHNPKIFFYPNPMIHHVSHSTLNDQSKFYDSQLCVI
jgi:hypothetical protein